MQNANILITGGTGFIGKVLCDRLSMLGYHLYILTRQKRLHSTQSVTYIQTLNELNDIQIEIIINLAGESIATRWTEQSKDRIYKSRIETTKALIEYIRSVNIRPKLFISASAIGFYGASLSQDFFEDTSPINTTSSFASTLCQDWERTAREAESFGIRTVLLRLGVVLGRNGGILSQLFPSFYLGLGSQVGKGDQWLSWIDRDDLIELVLFVMQNSNVTGVLNATSPNPITNKEFSYALATAMHRPCFLRIPQWVIKQIFGQMGEEIMLNGQRVFPKKAIAYGFQFHYERIEKSLSKIFSS
ncbi:MAG: TIGR01777 family protein [Gammaproteobacteria bacterium]|nr:TIGR01777 family protein [Gammaproteobacteria bacterium]